MTQKTIYSIPVNDKYLIYVPLKPLAFIGNGATLNLVADLVSGAAHIDNIPEDLSRFLHKVGFFEPNIFTSPSTPLIIPTLELYKPTICILMPTTACNLRCTYCYASPSGGSQKIMSWNIAKKAIEVVHKNAQQQGREFFTLGFHGGGEPTLAWELFNKAVLFAKKSQDLKCVVSLTTNGYWSDEFCKKILDQVDEVSLSFDGDKNTQNVLRPDSKGQGTFPVLIKTIKSLDRREIPYGIRMTVTRESLDNLCHNVDFLCHETNCQTIQIEPVYAQGRAAKSGTVTIEDPKKFVALFMEARERAKEAGRRVYYSAARPWTITGEFCTAFHSALIVTSEGELTSCYEVFDQNHPLSDQFIFGRVEPHLRDYLSDSIVLYPGKREQLAADIAENRSSCKGCFCYYHCAGDCPPKAFMARMSQDTRRCDITRMITRELLLEKIEESGGVWRGDSHRRTGCCDFR